MLGNPNAPIEMEMFIDVQCPVCHDYEVDAPAHDRPQVHPTGKVQLHLQPWAFLGAAVVHRPARRDRRREPEQGLRVRQGPLRQPGAGGERLADRPGDGVIAASVNGLDLAQWRDDVNSSARGDRKRVDKLATQKNVQGTPTILVGPKGGKLQNATRRHATTRQVEQALNAAIANASSAPPRKCAKSALFLLDLHGPRT